MINFLNKKENSIKKQQQQQKEYQENLKKKIENNMKILNYNKLIKPFIFKQSYNSIIPLHLYTCWHTKDLPPLMKANYDNLVATNPRITFHLYDEDECREFIKTHFNPDVLAAYDGLIPNAYKADLWRYCILHINGGIYMDIKYRCANGFKFISLTEEENFVRDRPEVCIYNALIVTLPKNEILLKCINQIVENVKNKYYGENPLHPTGPLLLGSYFTNERMQEIKLYFKHSFVENKLDKYYIVKNDGIILTYYDGYREEQNKFQKHKHYDILWNEKNIYR